MLRRKQPDPQPSAPAIEQAIALEEFRPALVAPLISRWQILPVDDPVVRAHPRFFRGLVKLEEK
jgi:hypothetical protein